MGKNKKKQSETIPLVPTPQRKRARRNKNKKLKKNLQGTNSIISNMPSIKVNESKKSKKRRFLKEQQQKASVLTKSNVKTTDKKQVSFGEASSESDAEPIEADWGSANDDSDNDDEQWQSKEKVAKSFTNSNDGDDDDDDEDDEQSDSESSDNDLEQSEEDEDEELSEDELNTLIQSQKKPMTKDTSKQKVSGPTKKPLKRTHESVENTPTSPKKMKLAGESKQSIAKPLDKGDNQASVSYSWANESAIIEEIKKRTIELSSATLYVSPLPSDCNESMLKSLSPSMVSYRFSTRKNKKIRGFVFLQYIDADAAEAARKAISGRLFAGNTITAQPNRLSFPISELKSDRIDRTQLFVTGFNSSTSKNDLMHIFPKGNIDFPLTKDGIPCGYAIVKFVNQNVSIEAFATTHKRLVRGLPIFVNFIFKKASLSKETDHKQNNKNQSEVNNTTTTATNNKNQSSEVKEKKLNKPFSSEKSSNVTIQKTTVDKKDFGSNKGSSKTKVLVQHLPESENDSQSTANSESNDESKTDELPVHQTKNKNPTTVKTSVLNDLVSSKMSAKNKTKAELSKLTDDGDDDEEEDDDEEDDDDDEEDDEDEISEYDEDDSGSEEEEDDDEDDDDDDDDDEDEEDLGDTDSDDASEDNDEVVNKNVIKKDSKQEKLVSNNSSALKNNSLITSLSSSVDEEQASSASGNNSSDEEIDKQLQAVIQAKRNSKKSFKSPNNAKRNSNFNAKKGNNEVLNSAKNPGKNSKPQWLRVPETKKNKKK